MRTHTFSVTVSHLENGNWTVAIVMTTFRQGVVVNRTLLEGPVWLSEDALHQRVLDATYRVQQLVREEEARRPAQ